MADFTVAGSMAGLDRSAVLRALGSAGHGPAAGPAGRSGCRCHRRVPFRRSLADSRGPARPASRSAHHRCPRAAPREGQPGARWSCLRSPRSARRAAGEMVSVLLDPATPDVVRRRLPLALKSCPSTIARDGLLLRLEACGVRDPAALRPRAAGTHRRTPRTPGAFPARCGARERELGGGGETHAGQGTRLQSSRSRAGAGAGADRSPRLHDRRRLRAEVPRSSTSKPCCQRPCSPRFSRCWRRPVRRPARRRRPADVRAELIRAGATMTVSLDELRRQLDIAAREET